GGMRVIGELSNVDLPLRQDLTLKVKDDGTAIGVSIGQYAVSGESTVQNAVNRAGYSNWCRQFATDNFMVAHGTADVAGDPLEDPPSEEDPVDPIDLIASETVRRQLELKRLAYNLDQQYSFSYPGSYYENEHGLHEKTIRSTVLNAWVGVLPNGNILNMDRGKELLHTGDPAFHEDPSLLFNAQEPLTQEPAPDTGGEAASAAPSLQALAWGLQQQYSFRMNGQLYFNEHKMNEKEFWSDTLNDWVIILPNGNIHRPGGGYPLLVAGDPAFYEDPSLLFNAEPPLPGVAPELLSRVQAAVSAELTVQIGEEAGALMEDYDAESQTLLTSVSVTNRELARIQGVQLFERSSFYIHGNSVEPILRRVMPAIFPENLPEYITQQAELLNEEPGHIQDRILMQQSDYRRIAGGLLGYYESAMSDLLNQTLDRIARMNAGELSESNLMRDLREAVGRANISRYIGEIASFGIRIPSAEELYREGQRLFTEEQTLLQHIQSEQGRLQEIDNFRASFREWQLGHGQPDLSVFIGADRGRAENGYQGTLTAGEERRLGRAQRLAEAAMGAMFDRRIQMRVLPEGTPITDRLQYGGDGITYLNVTARERESLAKEALVSIAQNTGDRPRAETVVSRTLVASLPNVGIDVQGGTEAEHGAAPVFPEIIELPVGTNELSRWWATAGEGPINIDWRVYTDYDGQFSLSVRGFATWDLAGATLVVDSVHEVPLVKTVSGFAPAQQFSLRKGGHIFTLKNAGVPEEVGVHPGRFTLVKTDALSPIIEADMKTLLIADHEEEFLNAGKVFRVEGQTDAMDVNELINHFAPVLHFTGGERFSVPFAVDPSIVSSNGSIQSELDLSQYETGIYDRSNTDSAVYASVIKNEELGELAITYNFFFPRSNWEEHGGQNTHEGDWEGATMFLKMNGDMRLVPDRIAVAQHIDVANNISNHPETDGGELSTWQSLEKIGTHPRLFVGLGGHALYFHPGKTIWEIAGFDSEDHSGDGIIYESAGNVHYISRVGAINMDSDYSWLLYSGYWGDDDLFGNKEFGDTAPRGPIFVSSGFPEGTRWLDPWIWDDRFNNNSD
ncbi:MAG TPA: NPP1 family protein, partial [Candidatus Peribacteraceae bacterium]|nr:NPP1 family protein [Candidatus Peribacteraceae bacterium]